MSVACVTSISLSSSRIDVLLEFAWFSSKLCSIPSKSYNGGFEFRICANGCEDVEVERLRVRRRWIWVDWLVEGVSGWEAEMVELRGFLPLSEGKVGRSSQR